MSAEIVYINTSNEIICITYDIHKTYVNLSHNNIITIVSINGFVNLQSLYLADNKITQIQGLDTLVNLLTLQLCYNPLNEISNIDIIDIKNFLGCDDIMCPFIKNCINYKKNKFIILSSRSISMIHIKRYTNLGTRNMNNVNVLMDHIKDEINDKNVIYCEKN